MRVTNGGKGDEVFTLGPRWWGSWYINEQNKLWWIFASLTANSVARAASEKVVRGFDSVYFCKHW